MRSKRKGNESFNVKYKSNSITEHKSKVFSASAGPGDWN